MEFYGREVFDWKFIRVYKKIPLEWKFNIFQEKFLEKAKLMFGEIEYTEVEPSLITFLHKMDMSVLATMETEQIIKLAIKNAQLAYDLISKQALQTPTKFQNLLTQMIDGTKDIIQNHWGKILTLIAIGVIVYSIYSYIDKVKEDMEVAGENKFGISKLVDMAQNSRISKIEEWQVQTANSIKSFRDQINDQFQAIKEFTNNTVMVNINFLKSEVNTIRESFKAIAEAQKDLAKVTAVQKEAAKPFIVMQDGKIIRGCGESALPQETTKFPGIGRSLLEDSTNKTD